MDGPSKQRKTTETHRAVLVGGAWRVSAQLQERLGNNWELLNLSMDDVHAGKADGAVAMVTSPSPAINSALEKVPTLTLLQSMSAGVEYVDFNSCPDSLTVCNTSTMDKPIAEYVMFVILHWQTRAAALDAAFRKESSWSPPFGIPGISSPAPFHGELEGKVLGIVGFGHIGKEIAKRAKAFDMRVIAVASKQRESLPENLDWLGTDLDRLLHESCFVVICCPLNPDTKSLINAEALAKMRADAVLINVARGPVVDEDALYNALQKKQIRGAALDVWWKYPSKDEPAVQPSRHPFQNLDNVFMTPHSSGWTEEQEVRKVDQVAYNLTQAALLNPSFQFVCKSGKSSSV